MNSDHADQTKADRVEVTYICPDNHQFSRVFAADAVAPQTWDCPHCGKPAKLNTADNQSSGEETPTDTGKSHWDMLLERRSMAELSDMLSQRAQKLRADMR